MFLVRHAKTPPAAPGAADHDRALAGRGRREAESLSDPIRSHLGGPLDLVLASTATRVRETLAGALRGIDVTDVRFERGLYLADAPALLEALTTLPDDVGTVLLCGHNPALHQLALALLAEDAPTALRHNLPPAGLVIVDLEDDGEELAATLVAFIEPSRE